jgi:isochorismate synthase
MIETKTKEINTLQTLRQLMSGKFPFALWRLPNQKDLNLVLSAKEEQRVTKNDLEELPGGFLMAPFEDSESSHFILADLWVRLTNLQKQTPEKVLNFIEDKLGFTLNQDNFLSKNKPEVKINYQSESAEQQAFEELVERAVEKIKQTETFQKVVLSRKKEIDIPENFDAIEHFRNVNQKYPSLFCSLVYLPQQNQIWIGASPEVLVSQDEHGFFDTMALAGTQSAFNQNGEPIACSDALWRQKEIEEQALVSRYIINCFKKIRVREFDEIGPKTIQAGNLMHLQTTFKVDSHKINFPQIASVMLGLLHPTSAVCGMPKEEALRFIKENEPYHRGFYSGYLGPVNLNQTTNLFVNLRSLCVADRKISLFAGCGITVDSNPEKEWKETEMKLKTIIG